jgi:hypothetical protein
MELAMSNYNLLVQCLYGLFKAKTREDQVDWHNRAKDISLFMDDELIFIAKKEVMMEIKKGNRNNLDTWKK